MAARRQLPPRRRAAAGTDCRRPCACPTPQRPRRLRPCRGTAGTVPAVRCRCKPLLRQLRQPRRLRQSRPSQHAPPASTSGSRRGAGRGLSSRRPPSRDRRGRHRRTALGPGLPAAALARGRQDRRPHRTHPGSRSRRCTDCLHPDGGVPPTRCDGSRNRRGAPVSQPTSSAAAAPQPAAPAGAPAGRHAPAAVGQAALHPRRGTAGPAHHDAAGDPGGSWPDDGPGTDRRRRASGSSSSPRATPDVKPSAGSCPNSARNSLTPDSGPASTSPSTAGRATTATGQNGTARTGPDRASRRRAGLRRLRTGQPQRPGRSTPRPPLGRAGRCHALRTARILNGPQTTLDILV